MVKRLKPSQIKSYKFKFTASRYSTPSAKGPATDVGYGANVGSAKRQVVKRWNRRRLRLRGIKRTK